MTSSRTRAVPTPFDIIYEPSTPLRRLLLPVKIIEERLERWGANVAAAVTKAGRLVIEQIG